MKNKFVLGLVLSCALPLTPALLTISVAHARPADVPIHTPKAGSKERVTILNALRIPVTKYHGGKRITFYDVEPFNVGGGWAYVYCRPANSKGKSLGPRDLPYLSALLRYNKGKWSVSEWSYSGDVVQNDWIRRHPDLPYNVVGLESGKEGGNY